MKQIKKVLGEGLHKYTMIIALIALVIFFNIASGGKMITPSNFQNLLSGNAYVLILAIGMLMVIVIGHIDLSVGSVAGFCGMVMAIAFQKWNFPWWAAVLLALAIGALVGAWNGFWVAKMGIPGFITTLGSTMIFRGAVIWISHSISVPAPSELKWFGAGHLPEWGPAFTGMNNSTLLLGIFAILFFVYSQLRQYKRTNVLRGTKEAFWPTLVRIGLISATIGYLTWLFGTGRPGTSFPVPGLILVILVIIYHIITEKTTFGRHIYAVGGNKNAAALSGINVEKTYFLTMLNMSVLAAVAGILFVGRSTAAGPSDGTGWETDAIAAVFIGGAAVSGGVGTVMATMVGGMVMAVLNSGLMLLGVGADKTQVIKGLVLLAAVAFDVMSKRPGHVSITKRIFNLNKAENKEGTPAEKKS